MRTLRSILSGMKAVGVFIVALTVYSALVVFYDDQNPDNHSS